MKTSVEFKFQFNHSSASGSAAIIDRNSTYPYGALREQAYEAFGSEDVKINKIGVAKQLESDGYVHTYDIYETYQDSGSNDYWYFAINTGCYEE